MFAVLQNANECNRAFIGAILGIAAGSSVAAADSFDAGKVMNEMKPRDRYVFTAGVVEGLAIARYKADGNNEQGMRCIYEWFYGADGAMESVEQAYAEFPSYPPASIISLLYEERCGE